MFSTCPFVCSSVRLFVRSSVTNLWTLYFENKWTDFNANWHKSSPGSRAWSVDLVVRGSKVTVTGGWNYVWKPGRYIILDPLSRLDRGMQWATEMLPLSRVLHIVLTAPPRLSDVRLADALVLLDVSHTIPVFPYQTLWQYSDGTSSNRGVECRKVWKIVIFDQYLALSRKW